MATREQTQTIKDFKGISRYLNSVNESPDKLYTCQNMYAPIKGELEVIPGVTKITGVGLPGCTGIKHIDFLKTAIGYERMLVFYDHGTFATPSAPNFTAVTGSGFNGSFDFYIAFVGLGGESTTSPITTVSTSNQSVLFTLPTIPAGCVSINVWCGRAGKAPAILGVVSARNGVFPASVTFNRRPPTNTITTPSDTDSMRVLFDSVGITFGTGGNLEAGKTYFFAVAPTHTPGDTAPYFFNSLATANSGKNTSLPTYDDPPGNVFAFTVPQGKSSVTLAFTDAEIQVRSYTDPYKWSIPSAFTTPGFFLFLGTTPTDLLAVGSGTDGFVQSYSFTDLVSTGVLIKELPYNTNIGTFVARDSDPVVKDLSDPYKHRKLRFDNLINSQNYENSYFNVIVPGNQYGLACVAMGGTTYSASTDYQILPIRGTALFSKNTSQSVNEQTAFIPTAGDVAFHVYEGDGLFSAPYVNRLYYSNNFQCPFYTNGYVFKPVNNQSATPYLPITKYIALLSDMLVLCGGNNSLANTKNVVYYSVPGDPETWTATPGPLASLQFISAIDADSDEIIGLGVYSESLSTQGISGFLIIGKQRSVYSWNGSPSSGAVLLTSATGFASPRSFSLTNVGPVFVGRENVFLMPNGSAAQEVGFEIQPILTSLSEVSLQSITCQYIDRHLRIGYQDTSNIDRELWLDFRNDNGEMAKIFTGPHVMKPYTQQIATDSFVGTKNFRVSFLGNDLYKRDDKSSYVNDGANIAVFLETNDMGFGLDDFRKMLNWQYIKAKITQALTITLGIKMYDNKAMGQGLDYSASGADTTFADSIVLPYGGSGTNYRLYQKKFATRYIGTLLRETMSFSTNALVKIQNMSWLFTTQKRRLL